MKLEAEKGNSVAARAQFGLRTAKRHFSIGNGGNHAGLLLSQERWIYR